MDVPEVLVPLAWLMGTWRGEGRGAYPTIEPFEYAEELAFTFGGKPSLEYSARTWLLPDRAPSHGELGFLRPAPAGGIELVVAQVAGAEQHTGSVEGHRLELASLAVLRAPGVTPVTATRRVYERRDDDVLWYRIDMAAAGGPLGFHCEATLRRVDDGAA